MRGTRSLELVAALAAMMTLGQAAVRAQTLPALSRPTAELATSTLPTLALEPAPTPSFWHGLSVGSEVVAVTARGGGGFGGDVFAGYDRAFDNGLVLGLRGATGYAPSWGVRELDKGFDFAVTDVRVGYDMGRVMPYLTAGVALARPHLGAGIAAPGGDSLTLLLNGNGDARRLTAVGAGVDVAITNDLTIGIAVNAIQGRGLPLP